MIKTILFDLDGTLLPMDQDIYTKYYLKCLAKKLSTNDESKEKNIITSVWKGFEAMVLNKGEKANEEVFFDVFSKYIDKDIKYNDELFIDFYTNEYQEVKKVCGYNPISKQIIDYLKNKGFRLVLATSPVFPKIATESRVRWAGLDPSNFEYITTYENSYHTKPNLDYYKEIMEKLKLNPNECMMVGNDVSEDMVTTKLGMKVFLLTQDLINKNNEDINNYPHGNFDDFLNMFVK